MKIFMGSSLDQCIIESMADGKGFRLAVFLSGCSHRCPQCHNSESWEMANGVEYDTAAVAQEIVKRFQSGNYSGITFSGGDPLYQSDAIYDLITRIRAQIPTVNIWCYTGFVYAAVRDRPVLQLIDTLVDGPFIAQNRFPQRPFRGSSNQRVLHLVGGKIVTEE